MQLGQNLLLKIGTDVVYCTTSDTLNLTADLIEGACKQSSNFKNRIAGDRAADISIEGYYEQTADSGYESSTDIGDALLAGSTVTCVWGGIDNGDVIYTFDAILSNVSITAPHNEYATFSATLNSTGTITKSTVGA